VTDPRIGLAAAVYVVCVLLEEGVLMTANPAIYSLREAVVHFGDLKRPVLQQISLRIPRGQFLTVVGPSGCGKSTLLRVLAGLQSLSGGELERSAEPASVVSGGGSAAELRAGFVFQQPALLPWRTALQNLRLPLELGAGSPDDERLLGLLEQMRASDPVSCRAACRCVCRWRGHWCMTRRCCCWMSRLRQWMIFCG
jgi:ABC-type glutathione transport system ATPase component